MERVEQHRIGICGVVMRGGDVALRGDAQRRRCGGGGIHAGCRCVMRRGGSGAGERVQGARQAVRIPGGSEEEVSRGGGVAVSVVMTHVAVGGGSGGVGRVKRRLMTALSRLGGGHVMGRG